MKCCAHHATFACTLRRSLRSPLSHFFHSTFLSVASWRRLCESETHARSYGFDCASTIEVAQRNKYTSTRPFVSLHHLMARMLLSPKMLPSVLSLIFHRPVPALLMLPRTLRRNETTFASFSYFVLETRRESNYQG